MSISDKVHSTCAEVAALHQEHIHINQEAVQQLARELPADQVRASVRGMLLPIKFESLEQEVTLMALYHLMDFGSGYDPLLVARHKRPMRDALPYGVIGLHISGTRLDAQRLKAFSAFDVSSFFGIEGRDEQQLMPGVTIAKPGPLSPLVESLVAAVSQTGASLAEMGCRSLGEYIVGCVEQMHKAKGSVNADALVSELADSLPALQDQALYDGRTVYYLRRAQGLVADLAARFGPSDARFAFGGLHRLAADSGNITAAVLRDKGVLHLSQELAAVVDSGEELPAGPHERALRAATVAACDAIAAAAVASAIQGPGDGAEAAAAGVDGAEGEGGQQPAVGGGAWPYGPCHVGAYLCFLTDEGQELHGKIKPHYTRGITGY